MIIKIGFFIRPIVIVCFMPWVTLSFYFVMLKSYNFRNSDFHNFKDSTTLCVKEGRSLFTDSR